jgi:hypothetical protein
MEWKMKRKILSLLICLLLISCGSPKLTPQPEIPELGGIQDVNHSITFKQYNVFPDNRVSLAFVNNSDNPIWFPADWHIVLLMKSNDGQWQQIQNQLTYSGENLLNPGGLAMVYIKPDIKGLSATLRVVIIGGLDKSGLVTFLGEKSVTSK